MNYSKLIEPMKLLIIIPFFSSVSYGQIRDIFDKPVATTNKAKQAHLDDFVSHPSACTQAEQDEWNRIVNTTQGIHAFDPVSSNVGTYPAEKNEWPWPLSNINNWILLSSEKKTLCGTLDHFNVYDGGGAEMDWNNFVRPNPEFSYLIDEAIPFKSGSDWHTCNSGEYCIEAEITPDQSLYENYFFPKSTGVSPLEGRDVCFYGPWVREKVHNHRPEIHPSEMIWWKDPQGYYMMFIQDDSNRFDSDGDFDKDGIGNPQWKPWAEPPLTAQFKVAFEYNPNTETAPRELDIFEIENRFVVTKDDAEASADSDNGKIHALVVDNRRLLIVNEKQENDENLGVKFVDICRRADGTIQGYIQITTKIGGDDINGDEGYHLLYLTEANKENPIFNTVSKAQKKKEEISQAWDLKSIRVAPLTGNKKLVGNLILKDVSNVEIPNAQFIPEIKVFNRGSNEFEVQGISIFDRNMLDIQTKSQNSEFIKTKKIVLSNTLVRIDFDSKDIENSGSWDNFISTFVPNKLTAPGDFNVCSVQNVAFSPVYFDSENDEISFDKISPLASYLNTNISDGQGEGIKSLYRDDTPFDYKWSFTAKNLITGENAIVNLNDAESSENAISISFNSERFTNDGISIHYPNDQIIYEVRASIEITDVFGNTSNNEVTLWNHHLDLKNNAKSIDELMKFSMSLAKVMKMNHSEGVGVTQKANNNRVFESLKLFLVESIKDERLTIDEINSIVKACENY